MTPAASVIIPTNDDALRLAWTLEGLCHQTFTDFEVVVVYDPAESHYCDKVYDVWQQFQQRFPDTKFRNLPTRSDDMRKTQACNLGVKHSRGEILAFLDADMVPDPDWLAAHLLAHHEALNHELNAPPAVVYGLRRHFTDTKHEWLGCTRPNTSGLEFIRRFSSPADYRSNRPTPDWSSAWGCSISMPASEFCAMGGYDERFINWGCEDNDLADRFRRIGASLHCLGDKGLCTHLDHPLRHPADGSSCNRALQKQAESEPTLRNGGPLVRVAV